MCLNSLTRGMLPPWTLGQKSTFRNGWGKFWSIVPSGPLFCSMLIPELLVIEAVMVTLQVEQQPTGPRFKSHLKPMLSKEIFIPIRKIFIDKNIFAEKRDCCGRIKKRCGKFRKKPDPETVPNNPEHLHNLWRINKPNFFGIDVSAEAASLQLAEAYLVWLKFVECLWSKILT